MENRAGTSRRLAVAVATTLGICSPAVPAEEEPEDCGVYYFGIGQPRDFKRAFACEMRTPDDQRDWMMVAVMYLNGEGTAASKMAAMTAAGIHVVKSPAEIGEMMARVLGKG